MHRFLVAVLVLVAAGCGDNLRPQSTSFSAPAGLPSVGGAQVARSKSFMLVTVVSSSAQPAASSRNLTLESGLEAQ